MDAPGLFALINARLDAPRPPADPLEVAEPSKAVAGSSGGSQSLAAQPSLVAKQVRLAQVHAGPAIAVHTQHGQEIEACQVCDPRSQGQPLT